MLKKEWNNLMVGDPVVIKTTQLDKKTMELKEVALTATVKLFNLGNTKALIKFKNGQAIWKGRLGIELKK